MAELYCSLEQLKARLGLSASDRRDDERLEGIIEAVSRAIDDECETQFYAVTQTRYFTAGCGHELLVDDLLSITTLKTDLDGDGVWENTWAPADFVLAPHNNPLLSVPRPYWKVERARFGSYSFPSGVSRGVQIVGSWGFSATVPKGVETVCLREALYQAQADTTPYGMTAGDGSIAAPPSVSLSNRSKDRLGQFKRVGVA